MAIIKRDLKGSFQITFPTRYALDITSNRSEPYETSLDYLSISLAAALVALLRARIRPPPRRREEGWQIVQSHLELQRTLLYLCWREMKVNRILLNAANQGYESVETGSTLYRR